MRGEKKRVLCYIVAFTYTLILASHLEAATLTVGSESGSPGDKNISVPIDLTSASGEKVCGFNFDLNFDTYRVSFKELTLSSAAVNADKSLSHSQPKPNTVRVIVIGLNQNVIGDGTVLIFTFDISDKAPGGKAELTINKTSVSDPKGKPLPVNTKNGELLVVK
jgi:hypothetical protein